MRNALLVSQERMPETLHPRLHAPCFYPTPWTRGARLFLCSVLTQQLDGTPVTRTFTVRNDGGGTLTLGTVNAPAGFTVTQQALLINLLAGQSTTFVVRLDTAVAGTKIGDITFTTNDPNDNPFNFRITGVVV